MSGKTDDELRESIMEWAESANWFHSIEGRMQKYRDLLHVIPEVNRVEGHTYNPRRRAEHLIEKVGEVAQAGDVEALADHLEHLLMVFFEQGAMPSLVEETEKAAPRKTGSEGGKTGKRTSVLRPTLKAVMAKAGRSPKEVRAFWERQPDGLEVVLEQDDTEPARLIYEPDERKPYRVEFEFCTEENASWGWEWIREVVRDLNE